jgi:hypothetical protein
MARLSRILRQDALYPLDGKNEAESGDFIGWKHLATAEPCAEDGA